MLGTIWLPVYAYNVYAYNVYIAHYWYKAASYNFEIGNLVPKV